MSYKKSRWAKIGRMINKADMQVECLEDSLETLEEISEDVELDLKVVHALRYDIARARRKGKETRIGAFERYY